MHAPRTTRTVLGAAALALAATLSACGGSPTTPSESPSTPAAPSSEPTQSEGPDASSEPAEPADPQREVVEGDVAFSSTFDSWLADAYASGFGESWALPDKREVVAASADRTQLVASETFFISLADVVHGGTTVHDTATGEVVADLPEVNCHSALGHVDGTVLCVGFTPGMGSDWTASTLVDVDPATGETTELLSLDEQVWGITDLGVRDGVRIAHLITPEDETTTRIVGIVDGALTFDVEINVSPSRSECVLLEAHVGCTNMADERLAVFSIADEAVVLDEDLASLPTFTFWTPEGWASSSEQGAKHHTFDGGEEPATLIVQTLTGKHPGIVLEPSVLGEMLLPEEIAADGTGLIETGMSGRVLSRSGAELPAEALALVPHATASGDAVLLHGTEAEAILLDAEGAELGRAQGTLHLADGVVSIVKEEGNVVVPPAG